MVELTADRLVLVDNGTATEYNGSMEDYIAFVLAGDGAGGEGSKAKAKAKDKAADEARKQADALKKRAHEAEALVAKLTRQRDAIDRAIADPAAAEPWLARMDAKARLREHASVSKKLEAAEAVWFEISESLEEIAA
jgi:ATP-binding cassette subfamily F protein 3